MVAMAETRQLDQQASSGFVYHHLIGGSRPPVPRHALLSLMRLLSPNASESFPSCRAMYQQVGYRFGTLEHGNFQF